MRPHEEPPRPAGTNVIIIVGATATGKTELSLNLADAIRDTYGTESELIAADKQTTRRRTEVSAAAPTPAEQDRAPHHMVGVLDPFEHLVPRRDYQRMARACIRDITSRDRLPIAVGGSVHLMEALAYYPGFHSLGVRKEEQERLAGLSLDDLRIESLAKGFGGPFEDNPRRWRNHIMARAALLRPWSQPPYPGTLLLGVRRNRQEQVERIKAHTDGTHWQIVDEVERLLLDSPTLIPPHIKDTIGIGDFWSEHDTPQETSSEIIQRTKQSIYDRTVAFATWQTIEISQWMEPNIRWVESAEEALHVYGESIGSAA